MNRKQHWEEVYRKKPEDTVSWFQPRPEISLDLIHAAGVRQSDAVIDVGGGASRLVDHLLAEGFTDISVLDIAEPALQKDKARLGDAATRVHWIAADITEWQAQRRYRHHREFLAARAGALQRIAGAALFTRESGGRAWSAVQAQRTA